MPMKYNYRSIAVLFLALLATPASRTNAATYGQEVVAAVLMAEAWGEGELGMTAVAEVIRYRADRLGLSPLAVVKQKQQFSSLNNTTPQALIRKFWKTKDWPKALAISRLLYNEPDKLPGITQGASHFDFEVPAWAEGIEPVAVIGNHKFWKLY